MDDRTNPVLVQRREFLKAATATLAWGGFGAQALAMQDDSDGGIATRPLGRTGERVPIVGLGGYHIGVPEEKEAIRIMHEAIDQGMTFFDNAWDYHDGGSEEVMGKALCHRRTPRQGLPDDEGLRSRLPRRQAASRR